LEDRVTAWTRQHAAEETMQLLQAAGVDAGTVENFADLNNDPQLAHRRHFRSVEHPVIGPHLCETNAIRFSQAPEDIRRPAACLGEHNEYVYRELLGMSAVEYAELSAAGVFR
jgi:benzylsuccinate CoA-transferase BbsF subunit